MTPTRTLNFAACSDRGLVRSNNEDSAYAGPRLLALADGMGGHAAGEVASQFLVRAIATLDTPLIEGDDFADEAALTSLLAEATEEGNRAIAGHIEEFPTLSGMGCTLTALLFRQDKVALCHVGDSRAYRLRDGELTQITTDDTLVQSLVDEGSLAPEDVSTDPRRSIILKALTGAPVDPTLEVLTTEPGDRYVVCSDGLSDPVSFDTIRDILAVGTPDQAARKLVEIALRGGGPDNVSVAVGDVLEADEDHRPQPVFVGAIAGEEPDGPRPDSSAARAAALIGHASGRAPGAATTATGTEATAGKVASAGLRSNAAGRDTAANDDSDASGAAAAVSAQSGVRRSRRGGRIATALSIVTVLGLLATGAFFGYRHLQDNHYVTEIDHELVVNTGTDSKVLGFPLYSTKYVVCLDENDEVTLVDTAESIPAGDCHRFSTADLTPAGRGALNDLPGGSLDEVQRELDALADRVLPPCTPPASKKTTATTSPSRPKASSSSGSSSAATTSARPSATPTAAKSSSTRTPARAESSSDSSSSRATKTTSSRTSTKTAKAPAAELSTPGVSCREVG